VRDDLSIREVVRRTGIEAPTLRMWEQRHGFPVPERLPSGHRRYSEADVELILQVQRDRAAGLELRAAIEKAKQAGGAAGDGGAAPDSIHAGLRHRRPDLTAQLQPKRSLVALSHAIEDECDLRSEGAVIIGSFQRELFYRQAEGRWRDIAKGASVAVALADFARTRRPARAPAEVPIDRSDPLGREWTVVCEAPGFAALLSAWERPGQDDVDDLDRVFETVWSVEPGLVRDAALVALGIVERAAPPVAEALRDHLERSPASPGIDTLQNLTNRMVAYLTPPDLGDRP
jgi:MerR family transcriptional regulator, light-induced transcriptional regulator